MAIVVVLAAVAIPTFGKQLETARESADMEVIRNAYTEVFTLATLDSVDGTLDGHINGEDGTSLASTGITIAAATGEGATGTNYTVTLASLEPPAKCTQSLADWQYVSNLVAGSDAPNNVTQATATLVFNFSLDNGANGTGALKLESITAANGQ